MKRFKRLFRVLSDTLAIVHRLDRWKIPLLLAKALVVSVIPFVVIVMSAEIINRLSSGGGFEETLRYALVSAGVICALTVLSGWLKKCNDVKNSHCRRLYDSSKNEKIMAMDTAELESPASNSLRTKLRTEENMGFGLPLLFTCLDILAESVFTTLLSLVFFLPVASGAKELPSLGLAVFILLSSALSAAASLYRKSVDDKILNLIKDDSVWGDDALQCEVLAYGGAFTYKEGKDVRIYGFQGLIRGLFENTMRSLLETSSIFATAPSLAHGAVGAARGLIMGGSYIFVAVFATGSGMELGTLILLASILYQLTYGISRAIAQFSTTVSVAESMQMYIQFIKTSDNQYKGTLPVEKRGDREYEVEFRGVSFKYPGSVSYSLKNLNLKLNIGKRMAVVGMNGSGKTTMIKLLCRLYDPTEGEILLNGINIVKYDMEEYRNIFSVVFQDFKLPSFELGQVLSSQTEYNAARAENCLRLSGFGERFASMPEGVKTTLYKDFEDGVEISGGEAQKIAMARALYKDAPFIVLDEPTAALDPISEFEVYSKFNDIVGDKTAVFISHRLSSCRFCDDIAVFHEGELIQRGGHEALLADKHGKYYELWNAQAQYYVS